MSELNVTPEATLDEHPADSTQSEPRAYDAPTLTEYDDITTLTAGNATWS